MSQKGKEAKDTDGFTKVFSKKRRGKRNHGLEVNKKPLSPNIFEVLQLEHAQEKFDTEGTNNQTKNKEADLEKKQQTNANPPELRVDVDKLENDTYDMDIGDLDINGL